MPGDLAECADLVLADVPCSGLGLLAKKPEIRLTMSHKKMVGLYPLQEAILNYAATILKTGGTLIYSTCTVNPAENIDRVQKFLAEHQARFVLEPLDDRLPKNLLQHPDLKLTAAKGYIQLLPHRHDLDGFFIARIRRVG
jgi:16S rRNA (cytosine967-C5)-methyltransferase